MNFIGSRASMKQPYSVSTGASAAFAALHAALVRGVRCEFPNIFFEHAKNVSFSPERPGVNPVYFPCPLREQDVIAAIKALEGCVVAEIANLRYGESDQRNIHVDLDKAACFLISTYLVTIDGMRKGDPKVVSKLSG
jgi:hypothetical protein